MIYCLKLHFFQIIPDDQQQIEEINFNKVFNSLLIFLFVCLSRKICLKRIWNQKMHAQLHIPNFEQNKFHQEILFFLMGTILLIHLYASHLTKGEHQPVIYVSLHITRGLESNIRRRNRNGNELGRIPCWTWN